MRSNDLLNEYIRVSPQHPCPICGHGSWCMVHKNGGVVICPRTVSDKRTRCGYKHKLTTPIQVDKMTLPANIYRVDFTGIHDMCISRMTTERLETIAESLEIKSSALVEMGIGWSVVKDCMTFPMYNEHWVVSGLLKRTMSGEKSMMHGSRHGVFASSFMRTEPGITFVTEGATDTATLVALGLNAVGKPSAQGGHDILKVWLKRHYVCIVTDSDAVGVMGAYQLKEDLAGIATKVNIVHLPMKFKDVRAFKIATGACECLQYLLKESRKCS